MIPPATNWTELEETETPPGWILNITDSSGDNFKWLKEPRANSKLNWFSEIYGTDSLSLSIPLFMGRERTWKPICKLRKIQVAQRENQTRQFSLHYFHTLSKQEVLLPSRKLLLKYSLFGHQPTEHRPASGQQANFITGPHSAEKSNHSRFNYSHIC